MLNEEVRFPIRVCIPDGGLSGLGPSVGIKSQLPVFWGVILHLAQALGYIWASVPSVRCGLCSLYGCEGCRMGRRISAWATAAAATARTPHCPYRTVRNYTWSLRKAKGQGELEPSSQAAYSKRGFTER